MHTFELILGLLAAVVALVWLSERFRLPYPMVLMAAGILLAALPWTPNLELDPEIVLGVFLPPILFQAAQLTSLREFKANFRSISRLAIGLVIVTAAAVAVVAHAVIPGIGWAAAFTLGAIVSPPDAVAATAIFQRLGVPRRIVSILEGESLINDASAIVLYTFAVAAVMTGTFSMEEALLDFVLVVVVGVVIGALVGGIMGRVIMILGDASLVTLATLVIPAATYVFAEQLHGSGVLAVVTAGLVHGYTQSFTMRPGARLQSTTVWELMTVAVNGFVFLLIGFELGILRETLTWDVARPLLVSGPAIFLTIVLVRFAWVYGGQFLLARGRGHAVNAVADPRETFVIAWSGLRGVVSLAMALALPLTTDRGEAFDNRDTIIRITSGVIIFSMYGLGLPLPWIVRRLSFAKDTSVEEERMMAQREIRHAMVVRIKQRVAEDTSLKERYRPMLDELERRLSDETHREDGSFVADGPDSANAQSALFGVMRDGFDAAREALHEMRLDGRISDEVAREMEQTLDLQALQFALTS